MTARSAAPVTEATLRAHVAEAPDDRARLLVYADWLEQQGTRGARARAELVRNEVLLRAITDADPRWAALVARQRTLAARIARAWAAPLACPRVDGLTFIGASDDQRFVARLLAGGALNYTQDTGSYQNGTWWQLGSLVTWEVNRGYATYAATLIQGSRLVGDGKNREGARWTFVLEITTVPETVAIPDDTIRGVYAKVTPRSGSAGGRAARTRA